MIADAPPDQANRLEALRRYKILDTPKEPLYDDIAFLAAQICGSPIAGVNFVDERRQWFKAEVGLGVRETPLDASICAHAILENEFLLVPDTLLDKRFMDNPLCAFDPHFRFYAGALLKTPDGFPLGTVCVLDTKPRELSQNQKDSLLRLARQLMGLLELRVALEEARTSGELAVSAMEGNTDCVKVLDLEGRILSMNQHGCRLMEVDDFSKIANHRWPEFWQEPENAKVAAALSSARKGKQARFSGYRKTLKGNEKYWEVTVSPIVDAEGKPSRILSVARDMTIRRHEEAKLRETAKLESLGVLAGGIAHDFNNLLTGVLGNASLLEMSLTGEEGRLASDIVEAAEHAADLTRQMLAYSGKGRFIVERVNLSDATRGILQLIRTTLDKKVELILNLDETLPPIEANPGQIQQLLMNLIINASEAMQGRPGKVIISTTTIEIDSDFIAQTFRSDEPSLTAGGYVQLEVQDTGSGMSEETISKIFDPFFTTKFTGRGLGLAAVSGILRGHRGAVRVYSHLGEGTTFKIFLPVAPKREPKPAARGDASSVGTTRRGWGTVLVADDEEAVRRIAQASLERYGYEVLAAEDGKQAIDLFKEHHDEIRLIILDLTMPVLNGEEAIAMLREVDPLTPIILSSGYNQIEIIRRFTKQSITGFIQKPYTLRQLMEAVAKALPDSIPSDATQPQTIHRF